MYVYFSNVNITIYVHVVNRGRGPGGCQNQEIRKA